MRSGLKLLVTGLVACAALPAAAASPAGTQGEDRAAALFDTLVAQTPRLRVFLQAMPKGADLHNHLWGTPYAEEFLGWAAEDGLCVDRAALAIVAGPCVAPARPAAAGLTTADPALYDDMINALSTRAHAAGVGRDERTGHNQFFATFDKFAPVAIRSAGRMLASARDKAAGDHVQYVELMQNTGAMTMFAIDAGRQPFDARDMAGSLARIAPAMPPALTAASAELAAMRAEADRLQHCGQPAAEGGCAVDVRYLSFALRESPPAVVFAQLAFAFALAERDPAVVGVNIVQPEDGPVSTADYDLHIAMLAFFHARHPTVKISAHAGELALGLVPPAALRDHIAKAVAAGASRIGHGVDIAHETDAPALLARMARGDIAVEINLTSNDTILGVKGAAHPLALYRAAGVPVVLSTDDEGVSRSDMTNEYLRAATEQGLTYRDLKAIARSGIAHAFMTPADKAKAAARLEADFATFETEIVRARF